MISSVEQPGYRDRYGKSELKFAETTEGANVFACMPFADELPQRGGLEYLAIAGAGQILDTLALVELQSPGSIVRVDLVDYNPCQLAFVARLLWTVASCSSHDQAKERLLSKTPSDVGREWQEVFQRFPELQHLTQHPDILWDALNRSLADTDTLRHYVFLHDALFKALKRLVSRPGTFHFHEAAFEHFAHPEGRQYHAIYGSDIHAWTPVNPLLGTLKSQLAPGGMALFALYGSATPHDHQEHIKRDTSLLTAQRASGAFTEAIYTPLDIQKRLDVVRGMLNIEQGTPWEEFVFAGSGGSPIKQTNALRLIRKES